MTNPGKTTTDKHLGPNSHLIGRSDARQYLSTPALIVDIEGLDRNIIRMAGFIDKTPCALRPHAKCHKSVLIAKRQLAAGAIGLCCASIGEAEVMGQGGIQDLLITSPLVTTAKINRLCTLAQKVKDIKVVVDNPDNIQALSTAAGAANLRLEVLVDIDPGMHRTGVFSHSSAIELARLVDASPNLVFSGLQCYAGHIQHIGDHDKRSELSLNILDKVAVIRDALAAEGLRPAIISGGGTGTYDIDMHSSVLTELQAGSYIFMDSQYNKVWRNEGEPPPFETTLFVQTTVTSANQPGFATTDAGIKQFASDAGAPVPVKGVLQGSSYANVGDDHGLVQLADTLDVLPLGTRIECVVPHCDPTVNLYNVIHCLNGDMLVDIWPIDARGT